MLVALAHSSAATAGAEPASTWTLDPLVIVPLLLAAALYAAGVGTARRRSGLGRGVRARETAAFAAGMAALFFALVWPLDALGEALFSAHMAQHLVLMNLAAPLLLLGAPLPAMFRALPASWRRALGALLASRAWRAGWRRISGAAAATLLQQVALWAWHTPRGMAAALENDAVHIAMHASLLAAALLFWSAVLHPGRRRHWAALAALAATLKVSGLVCIVLLLLPGVRYPAYGGSAAAWGLSPLEDEQLGWGLMMVVGSTSHLVAAVALFARWFLGHEPTHGHPVGTVRAATRGIGSRLCPTSSAGLPMNDPPVA